MKRFFAKRDLGVTMLLILSLFMQIVMPVVPHFAYAESGEQNDVQEQQGEDTADNNVEAVAEDMETEDIESEAVAEDTVLEDRASEEVEENVDVESDETEQEDKALVEDEKTEETVEEANAKVEAGVGLASAGKDLGNIFTDVKLTVDGEDIAADTTIDVKEGTTVKLVYTWTIDDSVDLKAGDWAEIEVPDAFKQVRIPESGDLKFGDEVVGTYELGEDNKLRLVFNDALQNLSDRSGEVGFGVEFNLNEFKEDTSKRIDFGVSEGDGFTITLKPKGETSLLSKSGGTDAAINPEYVEWVVDVNTSRDNFKEAIVEDIIPEGLELVDGSIEVYDLKVGYYGNITEGELSQGINPEVTDKGLKVHLGETNSAYRIKYRTKIVSYPEDGYTNKAILNDGKEQKDTAEFTIDKIERGSLIEKSGQADKNLNAEKITWQIDVNKAEENLKDVSVEDNLPEGLTLKDGTIKVWTLEKAGDKWMKDKEVTENFDTTKFPLKLGDIDGIAYRIVFETDIDYGKEYSESVDFENEAILKEGDTEVDSDSEEVTVKRDILLGKSGRETTSYGDPEITWTIDVNKANHSIKNATIVDTIGEGLKLREGSIKIDGKEVPIGGDVYPRLIKKSDNSFTIEFGDIDSSYKVVYITDIIDPELVSYDNEVTLKGDGLKGVGIDEEGTISKNPSVKPSVNNSYTKSRAANKTIGDIKYDGVNYREKTMSWVTTVDAKKEEITELTITDTFEPEGSMVFIEKSLRVLKNGDLVDSSKYTVTDNKAGGFVLEFNGSLDRAKYEIYYKTSFDPDIVLEANGKLNTTAKYTNKVKFDGETKDVNGKTKSIDRDAKADYSIEYRIFNGGTKTGVLARDDRTITWNIYVNALGQNLTGEDFVIEDTLSEGQVFNEGSLVVKEYELLENGSFKIGETLGAGSYRVEKTESGFTLTFHGGIDRPYIIEYTTNIEGISQPKYENTVEVTGKDLEKTYKGEVTYNDHDKFVVKEGVSVNGNTVYTDDEINWQVTLNDSLSEITDAVFEDTISPGHVYVNGSLKLYKGSVDEDNLVELEEGNPTVTHNDEGETKIELSLGDIDSVYIVTYDTVVIAKEGIITNSASLSGLDLDSQSSQENSYEAKQSSWGSGGGKENRGEIKIVKRDAETEAIIENNSAKFELYYYLNGEEQIVTGEAKATEDGEVTFYNLPFRTYYLREVEAPAGYNLLEEPIEINLNQANKDVELNVENIKEKTEVTGKKIWDGGPEEKPTIELQLYRDGEKLGDPVELENGKTEYTWTDLDKTDIDGKEYIYTVDEVNAPENYNKTVSEDGLTVTNAYVSPKTEVTGTKVWKDGPEDRPSIELQLYRDGKEYGEKVALEDGKTKYTWTDLDLTDRDGRKYVYTVDEVEVPENYEKTVSKDGLTVTNTYVSPKTEITGKKVWVNGPEERPSIELQLYRDGEKFGKPVALENGKTEYTWTDLDLTDKNGVPYNYTVDEVKVPENYEKDVDGLTVTNSYVIPKIDVTGKKVWIDGPKDRPTIELQLYRDGKAFGDPVALKSGTESYTWKDLDATDENGVAYKYTIDEVQVPENYEKEVSKDGLTITNKYVEPKKLEKPEEPKSPILPKTGATTSIGVILLGIVLLAIGIGLKKKRA